MAKYLVFVWQPTDIVFASTCIVVATDLDLAFAFLQSSVHETWARRPGLSKLENRPRYNPKKCYQTFPIPRKQGELLEEDKELSNLANKYYIHRQSIAVNCSVGQTEIYNRFHNPTQADPDIQTLRDLHIQMDTAVAAAYGWHDLPLNHDFHDTKQGLRFTISEAARREVLDRLLALNHHRYAEEVAQGLHDKKKAKGKTSKGKSKKAKSKPASVADLSGKYITQGTLFGDDPATQGELF